MDNPNKYTYTKISIPVTILTLLICIVSAGAGHGTYVPMVILFPYAAIRAIYMEYFDGLAIFLAVMQFGVYGLLLDLKNEIRGVKPLVLILGMHFAAFAIVMSIRTDQF